MPRRALIALAALIAGFLTAAPAAQALSEGQVSRILAKEMRKAGKLSSAYVVDLASDTTLYARKADADRMPASVEKLYTTAAAFEHLGVDGQIRTSAMAVEPLGLDGTLDGDLYLRGEGDPTLSTARLRTLASDLAATGLSEVTGRVIGDETAWDSRRGTAATGWRTNADLPPLGALMLNQGRTGKASPYYQADPPAFAAEQFARMLRLEGIDVTIKNASAGETPPGALALATRRSPTITRLARLMNPPSDNYIAEMLMKGIGAGDDLVGTTARGAARAESILSDTYGITPTLADGSGLSRSDRTSPREVVSMLDQLYEEPAFTASLAVAGRTGTLSTRMRGSAAQGICRGKTGTLRDVSNLAGYCVLPSGNAIAFAFLMNNVYPSSARALQDRMVTALARYTP